MKTKVNLLDKGVALATPDIHKVINVKLEGGYYSDKCEVSNYTLTKYSKPLLRPDVPKNNFTSLKDKASYYIIPSKKFSGVIVKSYIKNANGKVTTNPDKADYIVADSTALEYQMIGASIKRNSLDSSADYDYIISFNKDYVNSTVASTIRNQLNKLHPDVNAGDLYAGWQSKNVHVYNSSFMELLAAVDLYPYKIISGEELGILSKSLTLLTKDNVTSMISMLASANKEDRELGNHMLATFNYDQDILLTWELCRDIYDKNLIYNLNRRVKAIRTFVSDIYERYRHYNAAGLLRLLEKKEILTPDYFERLYKQIQKDIMVINNPGIYEVSFKMKDSYKQLLIQNKNDKNI
jgi:hypothetical protein